MTTNKTNDTERNSTRKRNQRELGINDDGKVQMSKKDNQVKICDSKINFDFIMRSEQ